MKTIVVDIDTAGNVKLDLNGFKGNSCTKITQQIQIALGGEVKTDKKPDFNLPNDLLDTVQHRI